MQNARSTSSSAGFTLDQSTPITTKQLKTVTFSQFFRYAFLISGIFYGASKLQALKAYEASKADERARKKVEREARLVQEKRMAAERDFQQIVEIFRPPPIPDDVNEPPKLVSEGVKR